MLGAANSFNSKTDMAFCPHEAYSFLEISESKKKKREKKKERKKRSHKNKYIIKNCDIFMKENTRCFETKLKKVI